MILQTIINRRLSITNEQEYLLTLLLTNKCSLDVKDKIKSVIKYKFYSSFDGKWFSNRIELEDREVRYIAGQSYTDEIKRIRLELLK